MKIFLEPLVGQHSPAPMRGMKLCDADKQARTARNNSANNNMKKQQRTVVLDVPTMTKWGFRVFF